MEITKEKILNFLDLLLRRISEDVWDYETSNDMEMAAIKRIKYFTVWDIKDSIENPEVFEEIYGNLSTYYADK